MYNKMIGFVLLVFAFVSCNPADKKLRAKTTNVVKADSIIEMDKQDEDVIKKDPPVAVDAYDSLRNLKINTKTLKGKRDYIKRQFILEQPGYMSDTLFDLNYDGYKDYVIRLYRQSGNGIKNGVQVFFYNKRKHEYILNEQLSALPNPTFYIKQKKITSFYIAGAGSGERLQWIKNKWRVTKTFYVNEDKGDSSIWKINYPLRHISIKLYRTFEMIPPKDILETNIGW